MKTIPHSADRRVTITGNGRITEFIHYDAKGYKIATVRPRSWFAHETNLRAKGVRITKITSYSHVRRGNKNYP